MDSVHVERPPSIYRIRIVLCDVQPRTWRVVEVPGDIKLAQMHDVVQRVMRWDGWHLHKFERDGILYVPDPDDWNQRSLRRGPPAQSEHDVTLAEVYGERGRRIDYEYDFGDSWRHHLWWEGLSVAEAGVAYPRLIDGAGVAPPEDFGGAWAWTDCLQKHTAGEDLGHRAGWFADDFDPEAFDSTPRPLGSAHTYEWPEGAESELQPDAGQVAMEAVAAVIREAPKEDDADADAPQRLNAEVLELLPELGWALHELFESDDGMSPRVVDVFETALEDDRFGVDELLITVLTHEELLEAHSRAPGYAAELLASFEVDGCVEPLIEILCRDGEASPIVLATAGQALRYLGCAALDDVIAVASSAEGEGRRRLLGELSAWPDRDERILEQLASWLHDSPHRDRLPVECLGRYGGREALDLLSDELDDAIADLHELAPPGVIPSNKIALKKAREVGDYVQFVAMQIREAGGNVSRAQDDVLDHAEQIDIGGRSNALSPEALLGSAVQTSTETPYRTEEEPGRNDPCFCGSGKKYKKCCMRKRR